MTSPRTAAGRRAAHVVRIIGGQWKRTRLPVADLPGLRPSPDRVRETLFNWLGQDLTGWRCLDAFAGTGALGFECASRGAAEVVLIERDPALARTLRETRQRLSAEAVRIECTDALAWMRAATPGRFDLVLLDPPFAASLFDASLAAAVPLLAERGLVYLEADRAFDDAALRAHGLAMRRSGRAGAVHFHLWKRPVSSGQTPPGDAP